MIMLKPARNYARGYAEFGSEFPDSNFAESSKLYKLFVMLRGNQEIRGKFVGLVFLGVLVVALNKNLFLAMQEHMARFVEEAEP